VLERRVAFATRACLRARPCGPRRSQACTPARVRRSRESKAGPWAPFSCPAVITEPAVLAAPPPRTGWPCRRGLERAHGRQRVARRVLRRSKHHVVHRHVHAGQPRTPRTPPPMASSQAPPRTPPRRPYRGQPLHWLRRSPCARARPCARHCTRAPHRFGSPAPPPRRRRRAHAGDDLARWSPPQSCAPFEPNSLGSHLKFPVLASRPGAVGLTAGEVLPRRRLPLLRISPNTWGHDWIHCLELCTGDHMRAWPQ
jgi:hypothetical protein